MKFFVVASVAPMRQFVINSEATEFQQARPHLMAALAPILEVEHAFLRHDSLVGCNEVFGEYSEDELRAAVQADPSCAKGELSDNAREAVRAALTGNSLLKRGLAAELILAWQE